MLSVPMLRRFSGVFMPATRREWRGRDQVV